MTCIQTGKMKCEKISQKFNRIVVKSLSWKKIKVIFREKNVDLLT